MKPPLRAPVSAHSATKTTFIDSNNESAPDTSCSATVTISVRSVKKTPRKVPHCTKCHRPRAGHPRQGCPYTSLTTSNNAHTEEIELSDALRSMTVSESLHNSEGSAQGSMSTLLMSSFPVIREHDIEDAPQTRRVGSTVLTTNQSTQVLQQPIRTLGGSTLSKPAPTDAVSLPARRYRSTKHDVRNDDTISVPVAGSSLADHIPVHSEMEETSEPFLTQLAAISRAPSAVAYQILTADVPAVQDSAAQLGLHAKVVGPKKFSDYTLIIVGSDSRDVETLFEGLRNEGRINGRGMASMNAAAGGVVFGAVATLTGLAFS